MISTIKSLFMRDNAAPAATPVRPSFPILTAGLLDRFPCLVGPVTRPRPANAMVHQTNDASLLSSYTLPSLPYGRRSASIDLASPPRSLHDRRPNTDKARPKSRSAEEKRLIGDFEYDATPSTSTRREEGADSPYSVPADRVEAPDPRIQFATPAMGKVRSLDPQQADLGSSHTDMMQPGQDMGFVPINNINDHHPTRGVRNVVQYGRNSIKTQHTIGKLRGTAQQNFLAREAEKNPTTPARSREDAYHPGGSHSSKRRKTEHVRSDDIIDVDAIRDDDMQMLPGRSLDASSQFPGTRHGAGSGHALAMNQSGSQPQSEFNNTESLTKPRRTKARSHSKTPGRDRGDVAPTWTCSDRRSASGSSTPHQRNAPIVIDEDDLDTPTTSARTEILDEISQGHSTVATVEVTPPKRNQERITSEHFPMAISETTAQTTTARQANKRAQNRQGANPGPLQDGFSSDELARDTPKHKCIVKMQNRSPPMSAQPANSAARRKANSKSASKGWPLAHVRTHSYHRSITEQELDTGRPVLIMRPHSVKNGWRILEYNGTTDFYVEILTLSPTDVIKATADDVGHIRLEGPRQHDGNSFIMDVTFLDLEHFEEFCDRPVYSLIYPKTLQRKAEKHLEKLFDSKLLRNTKVGTSPLVNKPAPEDNEVSGTGAKSSTLPLWDQLAASSKTTHNNSTSATVSTTKSTRPARATRSSVPTYDRKAMSPDDGVYKYSVVEGLGAQWKRPLTYGNGRRKATVSHHELFRLDEEEQLNDSLVDFFMIDFFDKSGVSPEKVFFFNTFFYTQLTKNTGRASMNYQAVEKWTSKIDIFDYDYIVVPICEMNHWYLAIICNVANIGRKPVEVDFDHIIPLGVAEVVEGNAKQRDQPGHIIKGAPDSPQPVKAADVFEPLKEGNGESGDEVNLFEEQEHEHEQSNLDLIDRDDTGMENTTRQDNTHATSAPQSPKNGSVYANVAFPDLGATQTVYSNLKSSFEKKKVKRKPALPKRDPKLPVIMVLDSLGHTRSPTVRALKDWLAAEGKVKRGMEAVITEKGLYPKAPLIPTQNNFSDCGVYLLGYAQQFFANPDLFRDKLLSGEMSTEEDWPLLNPVDMRNNLREILFKLAREQKLTEPLPKKNKKVATQSGTPQSRTSPAAGDSGSKTPTADQSNAAKQHTMQAQAATNSVAIPRPTQLDGQTASTSPRSPRLASPFESRAPTTKSSNQSPNESPNESPNQSPNPEGEVSDSPPISKTPAKTTTIGPHTEKTTGPLSSEVRIPVKTPKSQESVRNGHAIANGSEEQYQSKHGYKSGSPIHRNDRQSKTPPFKGRAVRALSADREHHSDHTSLSPRHREGSSDHPIEIADSQDPKQIVIKSPRFLQAPLSAQRRPPTRSPRALRHGPSIEVIPRPNSHTSPRKRRQAEEGTFGHELEAILDEDDAERARLKRSQAQESLHRAEESEPEPMDVDSQPTEVKMVDIDDAVVPETPSPESWTASRPLVM
jgi:sentrin-specific protease 7